MCSREYEIQSAELGMTAAACLVVRSAVPADADPALPRRCRSPRRRTLIKRGERRLLGRVGGGDARERCQQFFLARRRAAASRRSLIVIKQVRHGAAAPVLKARAIMGSLAGGE
jgi:hypothetical protein